MKQFLLIIFALFFSTQGFCQVDSLRGNVKSIKEDFIYLDKSILEKIKSSEIPESLYGHAICMPCVTRDFETFFIKRWYNNPFGGYRKYERQYDRRKNILLEVWFEEDEQTYKVENKYDKAGNVIQIKITSYDFPSWYTNMNYRNGRLISSTSFSIDDDDVNEFSFRKIVEDEFGNYENVTTYNSDGKIQVHRKEFDSLGRILREYRDDGFRRKKNDKGKWIRDYENGGVELLMREYFYNEKGQIDIENKYQDAEDNTSKLRFQSRHFYNDKKILTKKQSFKMYLLETLGSTTNYSYDEKNRITSEVYISAYGSEGNHSRTFVYNEKREPLELVYTNLNGVSMVEFTYKLDFKGNWIEKTKIINGKPTYKLVREIAYFD